MLRAHYSKYERLSRPERQLSERRKLKLSNTGSGLISGNHVKTEE